MRHADHCPSGRWPWLMADRGREGWWRARRLIERAQAGWPEAASGPASSGRAGRPPERYERWRSQVPFDDPALFGERLAADRMDEAAFLRVLRDAESADGSAPPGELPEW